MNLQHQKDISITYINRLELKQIGIPYLYSLYNIARWHVKWIEILQIEFEYSPSPPNLIKIKPPTNQ